MDRITISQIYANKNTVNDPKITPFPMNRDKIADSQYKFNKFLGYCIDLMVMLYRKLLDT